MKVAVLADLHSNFPALQAVLKDIGDREIYCVGDLVGYNPFPDEVVETVRERGIKCVMGNHDLAVVTGNTLGFNPYAALAIGWTRRRMKKGNIAYLASLPFTLRNSFYMVHGSPRRCLEEYVTGDYPEVLLREFLRKAGRSVLALAHTHVSFVRYIGDMLLFNPGSVGQPRDLDPRASYALLDPEKKQVKIKKVKYDVEAVVEAVGGEDLPAVLGLRLREGW
jgi:predicted phosphodiesterase